jgi:hypothetical protein
MLYDEADRYYASAARLNVTWRELHHNRAACKFDYSVMLKRANGDPRQMKQLWTEAESIYEFSKTIETRNPRLILLSDVCVKDVESIRTGGDMKCQYKKCQFSMNDTRFTQLIQCKIGQRMAKI